MIRLHGIEWYLQDPNRLLLMKPFYRGGTQSGHGYEGTDLKKGQMIDTGLINMDIHPVSQDLFLTEYDPSLHYIILNQTIPHIKVRLDGVPIPLSMTDMTQTGSFQKIIHAAHVRNLAANPLEFTLCAQEPDEGENKVFGVLKQDWEWRGMEGWKYEAIKTCKKMGNCGLLYSYDPRTEKYSVTSYSYEDGYQIIPNYDEYGCEIARSLVYEVDGSLVIDTYDGQKHYRITQKVADGPTGSWEIVVEKHGFPVCPLLHKRGKVAWEYGESSIEMWELMANIAAVSLKRFGTFALAFWGEMDKESFKRDSSTLIINLSSDTTQGRQDVKTLEFPEPQTMDGYLKTLEEKISLFTSTTFITPKDITTSNSGGNGIALAMSNDYALATQSAMDWKRFVNEMVYLSQAGMDLETNGREKFTRLRVGARLVPWSLETNNTKITNLAMEGTYLSTQTIVERCPDAAPDEIDRIIKERGELVSRDSPLARANAEKARGIAVNRSNEIVDNMQKVEEVETVTVNS